jgi:acid phosphatase (class A)
MNKSILILVLILGCSQKQVRAPSNVPAFVVNVDATKIMPGPPAKGSTAYLADFSELERDQATRTPQDCARAETEEDARKVISFFLQPAGPMTEEQLRFALPLLNEVLDEGRPVWSAAKVHWARPRPYVTDLNLKPCVTLEPTFAYPSGHSASSELVGDVLSQIFPELKTDIMARAFQIGQDRIIGGVHHPSDVHDGRAIADIVFQALNQDPNYSKYLTNLKE